MANPNNRPYPIGFIPEAVNSAKLENLLDLLKHVQQYGDATAFSHMGTSISFADIDRYSDAFAAELLNNTNLQKGDRIAIQLPNIVQYPIALYGAMKAGLVVVNTNPLYTPTEMKHQFNDAGVKAIIIYQSMADKLQSILADTAIKDVYLTRIADFHPFLKRQLIHFVVKNIKKMEPAFSLPNAKSFKAAIDNNIGKPIEAATFKPEDLAVLQYTGGTTGVAKGAMLSHANLISNLLQGIEITKSLEGWQDRVILPLPLYHIYAFILSQIVLYAGGETELIPNPRDIPGFAKTIAKSKPSGFVGLNTLFVALCKNEIFQTADFSNLKMTISGGMALTNAGANTWESITGCPISEGYGLTETSPILTMNPADAIRLGTIGKPLTSTEIVIIDEEGKRLPDGETGEICAAGPQVMVGYWNRQDATDEIFTPEGWLKTGDIGLIEKDGYVKIVDRAKDMINVSGFKVFPNQLEDTISEHPGITECAVIGVPDETTGEAVKLFAVINDDSLTTTALRDWCREKLTGYKVPKQVEFVDDLPKSNVGKILRRELRDQETRRATE